MAEPSRWTVRFHVDFVPEWKALPARVKIEAGAILDAMRRLGPELGRPQVDTLTTKRRIKHRNLKEIRCRVDGRVWRFIFAFDPRQQAIVLCGADKQGKNEARFYETMIDLAVARYEDHLKDVNDVEDS